MYANPSSLTFYLQLVHINSLHLVRTKFQTNGQKEKIR